MQGNYDEARKAYEYHEARRADADLQQAKLKALQDTLGNYGDFRYVDFDDFIDPDNQNWQDYTYGGLFSRIQGQGRVGDTSPVGVFISHIRDAKTTDDIKKQLEIWNDYKPLDLPHNGESYVNHIIYGLNKAPYGGSRPVFPTTDGSDPVQTSTGGDIQGGVAVGGTQGTQGVQGVQTGGTSGTQGSNNGSGGAQAGGTGSTGGMRAGNSGTTDNGTYASAGVAKGGTKTIGYDPYDPNPGNVSLAYVMRNAPEQERRTALINKWNKEHGRESVPYVPGTEIPAGSLTRSSSTYASPGISSGGMYATGEGIKDANGNVLTNPGGDWEYQYALKNPQYGLGMMSKMSDAQKNYLQAVSDNMGFEYNYKGAPRYV